MCSVTTFYSKIMFGMDLFQKLVSYWCSCTCSQFHVVNVVQCLKMPFYCFLLLENNFVLYLTALQILNCDCSHELCRTFLSTGCPVFDGLLRGNKDFFGCKRLYQWLASDRVWALGFWFICWCWRYVDCVLVCLLSSLLIHFSYLFFLPYLFLTYLFHCE